MDSQHLTEAQALSAEENWPHRIEDWDFMLALGRGAVALDGDQVVGTIMWWPNGENHSTLGMVIVTRERRRQRLGQRLMKKALAEIGEGQVTLNATEEGMRLYTEHGFEEIDVVVQHQGRPTLPDAGSASDETPVRSMRQDDVDAIVALDAQETGRPRDTMLRALADAGEGLVAERGGELRGYALARPFGYGHVIGPVVAEDDRLARTFVRTWIERLGDGFVRIDVRAASDLSDWLAAHGLRKVDEGVTMARGGAPDDRQPSPRLFALASQALG